MSSNNSFFIIVADFNNDKYGYLKSFKYRKNGTIIIELCSDIRYCRLFYSSYGNLELFNIIKKQNYYKIESVNIGNTNFNFEKTIERMKRDNAYKIKFLEKQKELKYEN